MNRAAGIDRRLGSAVGGAVRAHHRRRLGRIGWLAALDAPAGGWAEGTPPRAGCSLEVLIDGANALTTMARELEGAKSHVNIAGWFLSPGFALTRTTERRVVRDLLAELAERIDVRVLVWAGAPLPLFRPSRSTVRNMRDDLCRGTKIRCALDAKERPMHCHHEKIVVVDDQVAFVGGIDLTAASGDRFDSSAHPARGEIGWHDASTRIEGPAVADVARHFGMRWAEVAGERLPTPQPPRQRRQGRVADRADGSGKDLPRPTARGLSDPRVVRPCPALGAAIHLSREPVPVVARDRVDSGRQAPQSAV